MVSARVHYLLDNYDKFVGNTVKEQLSFAYVRAISSICAFKCERPEIDTGIDFKIEPLMPINGRVFKEPIIKVQVKSTHKDIINGDNLHFCLKVKYYNKLCAADGYPPAILVVYLLNQNRDEWLLHDTEWLRTSKTAYWYSFRGCKEIKDKKPESCVYIDIPKKNIFSPDTLESMMLLIADGGEIKNGFI